MNALLALVISFAAGCLVGRWIRENKTEIKEKLGVRSGI